MVEVLYHPVTLVCQNRATFRSNDRMRTSEGADSDVMVPDGANHLNTE